jgi:hypothetical protein
MVSKETSQESQESSVSESSEASSDIVNKEQLLEMYNDFIEYSSRVSEYDCKCRLPNFPEHISEHMIRMIVNYYSSDSSAREPSQSLLRRPLSGGDLVNENNERIECKAISSDGPITFGPTEEWSTLYILDVRTARFDDNIVLYKINLSHEEIGFVEISKNRTYKQYCKKSLRPRIKLEKLLDQLEYEDTISGNPGNTYTIEYSGSFTEFLESLDDDL